MVSKESKKKAINIIIFSSFVFAFASYLTKYLDASPLFILIVSYSLFVISGIFFVAAMLIFLYDRNSFLKTIKNDLRFVYKNLNKKR